MRNNLKSVLYHFIKSEIKSKSLPFIGGVNTLIKLRDLIEDSIENCCIGVIKTNNIFLRNAQEYLRTYNLPHDKLKLQYIVDYVLTPTIDCCFPPLLSVNISGDSSTIGESVPLTATGTFKYDVVRDITEEGEWTTDSDCAEVSSSGVVTFDECITCPTTITVTYTNSEYPSITQTHEIELTCDELESVEIEGDEVSTGDPVTLTAIGTFSNDRTSDITENGEWTVTDGCATVENGVVSFDGCNCPDDNETVNIIEFVSSEDAEISATHNITFECE